VNFLAHCALGSAHAHYLVGGFLGDFVKGPVPTDLPPGIRTGIRLHRRIDAFSAVQTDIKTSVARLPATSRRLAPVFVDLVADHFLARHFDTLCGQPLAEFSARAYAILADHEDLLPAQAARFSRFMREHDLFGLYADLEPVERAFRRIAQRLGREEVVDESMRALLADYREFEADFLQYYPSLREHVANWLTNEGAGDISAEPRSC
jgi:acyl carrier protein phosphodiesterase